LTRVNRHTVVDALPGSVSTGYRQSGEGLTGRGERRRLPPLLSRRVTENLSPGRELTTPTARPLIKASSRPFTGGGQCVAIDPDTVPGAEAGSSMSFSLETG